MKVQKWYKLILSRNDTGWILYRKISNRDFLICQFYTSLTGISDKILIWYLSISISQFQKLIQYFFISILPVFSISPMPGDSHKEKLHILFILFGLSLLNLKVCSHVRFQFWRENLLKGEWHSTFFIYDRGRCWKLIQMLLACFIT